MMRTGDIAAERDAGAADFLLRQVAERETAARQCEDPVVRRLLLAQAEEFRCQLAELDARRVR